MEDKKSNFKRREICEAISNLIIDRELKAGDKLGSERELAAKMNVQRLTIRRAIKQLCNEGLLEQRLNSGTYVKKLPEKKNAKQIVIDKHDSVFAPTSNIFTSESETVIIFNTNDPQSWQQQGWERIVRRFNRLCPNITVNCIGSQSGRTKNRHCDCALVRPHDLNCNDRDQSQLLFPETWISANNCQNYMPEKLVHSMNEYTETGEGCQAVPLMIVFPVLAVNKSLLAEGNLSCFPSGKPWQEMSDWLTAFYAVKHGTVPANPYIHSPLNHLCRNDRSVIAENCVDLASGPSREFLLFMKECWQTTEQALNEDMAYLDYIEAFFNGNTILAETFLHYLPAIKAQFKGDLGFACINAAPAGLIQVMPRYLALGTNSETYYETLEFCQYLASDEGQALIAEEGFGIPYYNGKVGAEKFCQAFQFPCEALEAELSRAEAFYDGVFFKYNLQERIVNPVLKSFFLDEFTIDEASESIKLRTAQQFSLLGKI